MNKDVANPSLRPRYTGVAIGLHWLMALGLVSIFGLGLYMHDLPLSPQKLQLYSWHKWAGVSLWWLAVLRLAWRVSHRPPALPPMAPSLALVAHALHGLLYVLMLTIPLSGWLMSSAKGFQTVWFGLIPLPDLVGKDAALASLLGELHQGLNFVLLALVVAHVGAALKHRFLDRDDVLQRMLPWTSR